MKSMSFAMILWLGCLLAFCPPADAVTLDEYGDLFHAVLNNMLANYTWQKDDAGNPVVGNWDADEMYDSTLFAPDILYRLANDPDYGDDAARKKVRALANDTVAYEMTRLNQYIGGDETLMLEAFVGAPCLISAFGETGDFKYSFYLMVALKQGRDILQETPNFIGDYMGYVGGAGLYGFYAYSYADTQRKLAAWTAQRFGAQVLEAAVDQYWDDAAGRFWPVVNLYEDGWMLMGLAYAYGNTGDKRYKAMADAVMHEIDTRLWDTQSEGGGYWEYEDYMYKPSLGRWKKLSTHERIARAMLHWFEVTGDTGYLDQARKMLDYVAGGLCVEDLHHPGQTICYHHWTVVSGLPHTVSDPDAPGFDPYYPHPFCTGCNFNLLIDIYLLNKFTQEAAAYPRTIGVCVSR